MKTTTLSLPLVFLSLAVVLSGAGQIPFAPGFGDDNDAPVDPRTPVPLSTLPCAITDFEARVKVAVEQRSLVGVEELYQTNAVTADDLKRELARWQPLFAQPGDARVSLFFKELDTLPPKARQVWTDCARGLTTNKVTHLVHLQNGTATALVLPLVEIDGRLWIVPADKRRAGQSVEPGPGAGLPTGMIYCFNCGGRGAKN